MEWTDLISYSRRGIINSLVNNSFVTEKYLRFVSKLLLKSDFEEIKKKRKENNFCANPTCSIKKKLLQEKSQFFCSDYCEECFRIASDVSELDVLKRYNISTVKLIKYIYKMQKEPISTSTIKDIYHKTLKKSIMNPFVVVGSEKETEEKNKELFEEEKKILSKKRITNNFGDLIKDESQIFVNENTEKPTISPYGIIFTILSRWRNSNVQKFFGKQKVKVEINDWCSHNFEKAKEMIYSTLPRVFEKISIGGNQKEFKEFKKIIRVKIMELLNIVNHEQSLDIINQKEEGKKYWEIICLVLIYSLIPFFLEEFLKKDLFIKMDTKELFNLLESLGLKYEYQFKMLIDVMTDGNK